MERQWLMEGYNDDWHPHVGYAQQKDRAFFFFGAPDQLVESLDPAISVVDSLSVFETADNPLLQESILDQLRTLYGVPAETVRQISEMVQESGRKAIKDATWIIQGPYQRWDTKNINGRTYGKKIWERTVDPNGPTMKLLASEPGGMLGHVEHPKDGRTDGNLGALSTRGLRLIESDKAVWGTSHLLDTPGGLILQEYTRRKQRYGISSRGSGTVAPDGKVADDFNLVAFDAVMNPSTPGAFPQGRMADASEEEKEKRSPRKAQIVVPEDYASRESGPVKNYVESVRQLIGTDLEGLNESELKSLNRRLLDGHLLGGSLVAANALSKDKAADLQNWLALKMLQVHEATGGDVFQAILDNTFGESADLSSEEGEAFARIVKSLHARLRSLTESYDALKEQAEHTGSGDDLAEALKELAKTHRLLQAAEQRLQDRQEDAESLEARLTVVQNTLAESCTEPVETEPVASEREIENAVQECIEDTPELGAYRDTLCCAATLEDVRVLAESLMPAVLRERADRTATRIERSSLPHGLVVESLSNISAKEHHSSAQFSPGAKMAGVVLKTMAPKR